MSPLRRPGAEQKPGRWWTLGGAEVLDMMSVVEQLMDRGRVVHIGSDAQKSMRRMEFVTVVCVLNPGKGGRVFYTRQFADKHMSLFDKLSMETWMSLELALRMNAEFKLPEEKKRIWVHVDANPDTRYDSSNYVKQLAGGRIDIVMRVLLVITQFRFNLNWINLCWIVKKRKVNQDGCRSL